MARRGAATSAAAAAAALALIACLLACAATPAAAQQEATPEELQKAQQAWLEKQRAAQLQEQQQQQQPAAQQQQQVQQQQQQQQQQQAAAQQRPRRAAPAEPGKTAAPAAVPAAAGAEPTRDRARVPAPAGTVAQLWEWYDLKGAPTGATPAFSCLAEAFKGAPRDRKVYSQWGEDGIIEAIFGCIGTKDKYYVEFGTETCEECTTRYLRDKGWTGLLMDGSNANPSINLHTEYMRSDNIVQLFQKYKVPHPEFDHLTADIDLNTFWVLRAILSAGYRPRSVAIEYNRNFGPRQSYTTLDMPEEVWAGTCYFGASALAYERLMRAYGYTLVAFDTAGVNVFFVKNSEVGVPFPHTFASVAADYNSYGWQSLHHPCPHSAWGRVEDEPETLAGNEPLRAVHPIVLSHRDALVVPVAGGNATGIARRFYEARLSAALGMHRPGQHAQHAQHAQHQAHHRRRAPGGGLLPPGAATAHRAALGE